MEKTFVWRIINAIVIFWLISNKSGLYTYRNEYKMRIKIIHPQRFRSEQDNESLESSRLKVSRFTGRVWDLILLALHACEIFSTPWCLLPEPSFFLISHLDLSSAFFRMKYALALFLFFSFFLNHSPIPLNIPFWNINRDNRGAYRSMAPKGIAKRWKKTWNLFMLRINVLDVRRYLCIEMNKEISKNLKYSSWYMYIYIFLRIPSMDNKLFLKNFLR